MPLPPGSLEAPWCAPLAAAAARLGATGSVAERLNAAGAAGAVGTLRFVPQSALPAGEAYEAFIFRTGQVPTRNNAHDLLNGLMWLAEPAVKARLNQLQAEALARDGVQARRGPLRDALTLFDENGACWPECPPAVEAAWRRRDWAAMFLTHREAWHARPPRLFGHALLEQLALAPRKGLCAHVLLADPLTLSPEDWARKPFLPLPVLGVPGWWAGNAQASFYDDPAVFRPLKSPA